MCKIKADDNTWKQDSGSDILFMFFLDVWVCVMQFGSFLKMLHHIPKMFPGPFYYYGKISWHELMLSSTLCNIYLGIIEAYLCYIFCYIGNLFGIYIYADC